MCFSPEASFAAAGLTGLVGCVCVARTTRWRELPLALTPLLFGIQQSIEGGLWLTLRTAPTGPSATTLTLVYLLFAKVFWPAYAPFAACVIEPAARRRNLMLMLVALGLAVAGYVLPQVLAGPRAAEIARGCIVYHAAQDHADLLDVAYLLAVSLPLLLSSYRAIVILGVIVVAGCLAAYALYAWAALSVWCFFAAAASITLLAHFEAARRRATAGATLATAK